jgi:hypothetical protein
LFRVRVSLRVRVSFIFRVRLSFWLIKWLETNLLEIVLGATYFCWMSKYAFPLRHVGAGSASLRQVGEKSASVAHRSRVFWPSFPNDTSRKPDNRIDFINYRGLTAGGGGGESKPISVS